MKNILQYGKDSTRKRQRLLWWVLLSTLFTWTCLLGWSRREHIFRAIEVQYYQRQCTNFEMPPNRVAYDSDHERMAKAASLDPAYWFGSEGYGYYPAPLQALEKLFAESRHWQQKIAFMHERISPGGRRRLVLISVPTELQIDFYASVILPSKWLGSCSLQFPPLAAQMNQSPPLWDDHQHGVRNADGDLTKPLRVFFGQPDPRDESHFTIRYEVGDEPGIIDGWLGDDDAVRMQAHGPWAIPPRTYLDAHGNDLMDPKMEVSK